MNKTISFKTLCGDAADGKVTPEIPEAGTNTGPQFIPRANLAGLPVAQTGARALPVLRSLVLLYAGAALGFAGTTGITYESYNPATKAFNLQEPIAYSLPNPTQFGPGPYPVFIWLPGTFEHYQDELALGILAEMNQRGFLAASVAYSNSEPVNTQTCSDFQPRAQGVFDATRATSAVSTLCSLAGANCNPGGNGGVVVMGISQGGLLSVLGKNFAPNLQAVYAVSIGDDLSPGFQQLPCVDKNSTAIGSNRLTVIDGVADQFFQNPMPQVQNVTGLTCPAGSTQCWSPDGSGAGWYIVQNSQVSDGNADHCYFIDNLVATCNDDGPYDPNWLPPSTYNWSVGPNLDWLASFGTHRVFSSTGY